MADIAGAWHKLPLRAHLADWHHRGNAHLLGHQALQPLWLTGAGKGPGVSASSLADAEAARLCLTSLAAADAARQTLHSCSKSTPTQVLERACSQGKKQRTSSTVPKWISCGAAGKPGL